MSSRPTRRVATATQPTVLPTSNVSRSIIPGIRRQQSVAPTSGPASTVMTRRSGVSHLVTTRSVTINPTIITERRISAPHIGTIRGTTTNATGTSGRRLAALRTSANRNATPPNATARNVTARNVTTRNATPRNVSSPSATTRNGTPLNVRERQTGTPPAPVANRVAARTSVSRVTPPSLLRSRRNREVVPELSIKSPDAVAVCFTPLPGVGCKTTINNQETPRSSVFVCPICFSDIKATDRDNGIMSTECGHMFCKDCLMACYAKKAMCPMCQQAISDSQFRNIYI